MKILKLLYLWNILFYNTKNKNLLKLIQLIRGFLLSINNLHLSYSNFIVLWIGVVVDMFVVQSYSY